MEQQKMFVCEHENGKLSRIGIVHWKRNGRCGIEFIDYIAMCCLNGHPPCVDDDAINLDNFYELAEDDLQSPKFYYDWRAVLGEFLRFEKEGDT